MLYKTPPLLISGMHRSGTTLLVEILMKFGFFPGERLDENLEATFFQRINEWVLRRSGGAWDNPNQVTFLLKSITSKNEVVGIIKNEIASTRFSEYKKQKSSHKNEKVSIPIININIIYSTFFCFCYQNRKHSDTAEHINNNLTIFHQTNNPFTFRR